jgi:ketosteroid isomerase-like protein
MKRFISLAFVLLSIQAYSQSPETAIRQLLEKQTHAWNQGNVEEFMQGYWKSDSLVFVGKSGVTYGWNSTLKNYKRNYPDAAAMGELKFTLLSITKLSSDYYHVIGKWHLERSIGNLEGHFTLLFRKLKGQWYIIADHSS